MTRDEFQRMSGPVSRETWATLEAFARTFTRWNAQINLVASSTTDDLWRRHLADSAQLLPLAPAALHWVDVGSGGGFPGLVLALLLKDRPNAHVDLVESNRKKAGFLQSIVGEFGLPARVHARRIEHASVPAAVVDRVTARALAPLPRLLALTERWLGPGAGTALFHKGRDYRQELAESADKWSYDLIDHPSLASADSVILEISNVVRRRP